MAPVSPADWPLVSIVIITYNDRQHVGEAIESALAQTYPHCEVIVVDDGSTDGTETLVRQRYGDRIKYVYKPNGGMGSARHAGLSVARGKYVQHLDSDDMLLPHKIRGQVDYLEAHPEVAAAYGRTLCFYDEDPSMTFEHGANARARSGNLLDPILRDGNFINVSQPLFRRAALDRVGGWDPAIQASDDYDIQVRLAYAGEIVHFLDGPGVFLYRQRRARFDPARNPAIWRSPENLFRGEIYILEKLDQVMARDGRSERFLVQRRLGEIQFQLGRWLFRVGQRGPAVHYLLEGLKRNRTSLPKKLAFLGAAAFLPGLLLWRLKDRLRSGRRGLKS